MWPRLGNTAFVPFIPKREIFSRFPLKKFPIWEFKQLNIFFSHTNVVHGSLGANCLSFIHLEVH